MIQHDPESQVTQRGKTTPLGTNAPVLTPEGIPLTRAISSPDQLKTLVDRLLKDNAERNKINGRIMRKYNAERAHDERRLESEGLAWKANLATQPLPALVERVSPRFVRAANSTKYVTNSSLPPTVPNATAKSEVFRAAFTRLCRSRPDWTELLESLAQENALFGWVPAAFPDPFQWFPQYFPQHDVFVPQNTVRTPGEAQVLVLRRSIPPHKLQVRLSDPEEASKAGWIVENLIQAIQEAEAENINDADADARKVEELKREVTAFHTYAYGAAVVETFDVFVTELTGTVSHYIVAGKERRVIFGHLDRFTTMADVATFLTFQHATGRITASKGIGRTLYEIAAAVDRSRNEVIDRLQLSGKIIVQGDESALNDMELHVFGQLVGFSSALKVTQTAINPNVEAFTALDTWLNGIMDELAGNVSPTSASAQLRGERVTNGQINYLADIQAESKDAKITRFLLHVAEMISVMQRRVADLYANREAIDPQDANRLEEFFSTCLEHMSEEEMLKLLKHPAVGVIDDYTDAKRQRIIIATSEIINSPLVDPVKVLRHRLTAAVDSEFADDVISQSAGQERVVSERRAQKIESLAIAQGVAIPAVSSDLASAHLEQLLKEDVVPFIQQLDTTPDTPTLDTVKRLLQHAQEHIMLAQQAKTEDPKVLDPLVQIFQQYVKGVEAMNKATGQPQAQAQAELDAQQQPPEADATQPV